MGIEAVIFDMDGLLIDSEPLWKEAEIAVFATVGIELTVEMCHATEGFRLDEAVAYWYQQYPWQGKSLQTVEQEVMETVSALIRQRGKAMPGVYGVLDRLQQQGLKLGLASSSVMQLIETVVDQLRIRHYFEVLWSAEYEQHGKPHPAVFLTAAQKLGVDPAKVLVFEDSYNGLLAAKNAGMVAVAVPDPLQAHLPKFDIADLKLPTLEAFTDERLAAYVKSGPAIS
jgi:sugar-phosphatase